MKKGGASATSVTYSYTGTFAIALARGVVDKILKIWMDSTLVYDLEGGTGVPGSGLPDPLANPTSDATDSLGALGAASGGISQSPGLNFRFYPGDEDQLPDSRIEADRGVGNVPAFRGTSYLVFEDLPLAKFGNRIPNVNVLIAYTTTPSQNYLPIDPTSAVDSFYHDTHSFTRIGITVDPVKLRGYIFFGGGRGGVTEFDLLSMEQISSHSLVEILQDDIWGAFNPDFAGISLLFGFDQMLYIVGGTLFVKVNPNTWRGDYLILGVSCSMACVIGGIGPDGIENYIVMGGGAVPGVIVSDIGSAAISGTQCRALTPGAFGVSFGYAYVLSCTGSGTGATVYIDRVNIQGHAGALGAIDRSVSSTPIATIEATAVDPTADGFSTDTPLVLGGDPSGLVYDIVDVSVIFQVSPTYAGVTDKPFLVKVDIGTGLVVWATKIENGTQALGGAGAAYSNINGGRYAKIWGKHVVELNTANGVISADTEWTTLPGPVSGQQIYDSFTNSIIFPYSGYWIKAPVGRATGGATSLEEIFSNMCDVAGLEAADYDATLLSDIQVPGYVVSQRTSAADVMKPLANLYQVDAVESDWKIVFRPRGGAVVAALAETNLVRTDSDKQKAEAYNEIRTEETSLPVRYSISYTDPDSDYQVNTQLKQRVREPIAAVYSDQQIDLAVGVVMSADTARQAAEKLLYTAWTDRHQFQVTLPPDYLWLDAADPVSLTLNDGYVVARGRLGSVDMGVDYSQQTTLVEEVVGQYVSTIDGQVGLGIPPDVIPIIMPSALFMLDVPLLRDTDDAIGLGIRGYWAAAPFSEIGWPGAVLEASADSASWVSVNSQLVAAPWGYVVDVLPDAIDSFHTHYEQSITVFMNSGGSSLASMTALEVSNGANAAAVIKDNGEIEIIQFLDVVSLGGQRYTLSALRRGVRGTDTMAGGHAAGEVVVMLGVSYTSMMLVPQSGLNLIGYYRAVTIGTSSLSAIIDAQIFHGRDQMPYAPVHVAAEQTGTSVVITWVRRTRVAGYLAPGTGTVPLSESVEAYEVDIYNSGATAVLRTIAVTSEAATYTNAQMTSDFGSEQTTLHVAVYQMSDTVGRGFGRIDTLTIGATAIDVQFDGGAVVQFDGGGNVVWG